MSVTGKALNHVVGNIIGVTFRGGTTGQAERWDQ